jgi:chromate transporter
LLLAGGAGLAFWTRGSRTADRPGAVVAALGAKRVAPILVGVAAAGGLPVLAWVFLKTGLLMFGGGYVLIPLLQPEVLARHWLTKAQFLDGIALGQATPGPITTSSAFIGYAVAGFPGAVVATVAVYLPAFVAVLGGTGPFLRSFQHRPAVAAFVRGVTAGALGAILGAAILLAPAGLNTVLKIVIGVVAGVALFRRVPIWAVLPAAALVSVLVSLVR